MKRIHYLVLFLFTIGISNSMAQSIKWMSFNEAIEAQKKNPKKIFIDVYAIWCGPCKMLEKNTFSNKKVAEYINTHFYAVKFNAEGNESITYKGKTFKNPGFVPDKKGRNATHEFTLAASVKGYPTMIFLDENADMIFPISGYYTPSELEPFLKLIGSDKYKSIKTQKEFEDYQKNFKSTFSD